MNTDEGAKIGLVKRDANRRLNLMRESVQNTEGDRCKWCGKKPDRIKRYWIESDHSPGVRMMFNYGEWFCSKACWENWN